MAPKIEIPREPLESLCKRWKIAELALFGSVLREDFTPNSDIDILVTFSADAQWGLLDLAALQEDLANLFGRAVDLVTKRAVERSRNWVRRRAILDSAKTYYVS